MATTYYRYNALTRALIAAEIAANHSIDRARFNLA